MKKLFGIALGIALVGSQFGGIASSVLAAEASKNPLLQRVVTSEEVNGDTEVAVSASLGAADGENLKQARAFSGDAFLDGTNPLLGKPYMTATTTTNKSAYIIKAQVSVNNNGQSTPNGPTTTLNNTTKVTTSKLTASTEQATFTGTHSARETANSSLFSATTKYTFK